MGLTYAIERAGRLVLLRYDGETSYSDWRAVLLAALADPGFVPGASVLADRRLATTANAEFVRAVVAFLSEHADAFAGGRWATLVASPAAYGMSRMAQTLASDLPFPLRIFTDEDEAIAWIEGSGED